MKRLPSSSLRFPIVIVLLLVTTSCVRTTVVENIPPGGIAVEHTTTRYTP